MIAIVPAAGRGRRLAPITRDRPKALVPVAGIPCLRRVLTGLDGHVDRIIVVSGHLGEQVRTAVAGWDVDTPVDWAHQEAPLGTADAIRAARTVAGSAPFLYAWSDVLTPDGLVADVVSVSGGDHGVIAVDPVPDVGDGADVRVRDGRVVRIVEKPPPGSGPGWNATGVGTLPADVWGMFEMLTPSSRGEFELTDVLARLTGEGRLGAVAARGPVFDIGTPARLTAAEDHYRSESTDSAEESST